MIDLMCFNLGLAIWFAIGIIIGTSILLLVLKIAKIPTTIKDLLVLLFLSLLCGPIMIVFLICFLVDRYGEVVVFKPKENKQTENKIP